MNFSNLHGESLKLSTATRFRLVLLSLSVVILVVAFVAGVIYAVSPTPNGLSRRMPSLSVKFCPVHITHFFVEPGQPARLSWRCSRPVSPDALSWRITNYWGHEVAAGKSVTAGPGDIISLPVRLARGFYQVTFPASGQQFGVVSIAAHRGPADSFFAIDSAMSELVNHPADRQRVRVGMIRILRRSGIGMSRERLRWSQINPSPGRFDWNKDCQYGLLGRDYSSSGVRMLQLFADAPDWTWDGTSGPYPINLVRTARSWAIIGSYFHRDWGALEIWNEPDGHGFPANQLLPMIKAIAYSFQQANIHIPLIGGVFASPIPGQFQRVCAMNGLLDQVSAISFHDYRAPTEIPHAVAAYRQWLKAFGEPSMPLWITESGKPWAAGTARPRQGPDMTSALWITMKAVEARACGISRYFAFVYPFYTEHDATFNNFGMMGQEHTPLRSMAGYVNCVAELSGWSYVGNLKTNDRAVLLAPVFARGERRTAVVYTGKANAHAAITLRLHGISIRGIDGRILHRNANGSIPIADGLVYLRGPAKLFVGKVETDTEAGRLYAISRQSPPKPHRRHSPIILQFDNQGSGWTPGGYVFPDSSSTSIRVRVWNLANHAISVKLTLRGHHEKNPGTPKAAFGLRRRIPAQSNMLVQWTVSQLARKMGLGITHYHYLMVTGHEMSRSANTPAISPLAIPVRLKGSLNQYLARYPRHTRLAIGNTSLWRKNLTANADMSFFSAKAGGWGMKVAFHGGSPWAYPQFPLPSGIHAKRVVAVLLRARASAPAKVRLMLFKPGQPTYGTLSSPIIAANGKWNTVLVPLARLKPMGNGPPLHSLAGAKFLSVGLNNSSAVGENQLEVSDLYLLYGR